jgi:hypothetical protein
MREEDAGDGTVDNEAVSLVVGALEQTEVANEKGNLEEADADLVNGSAGVVDPGVDDEIGLRTVK